MLTLYIAYTEPVNGADPATPTLTQEQVWNGIKLKARCPEAFIPSFDGSRVVEERENGCVIVRDAHVSADLHESPMAGKWTREECRLHAPVKTCFTLPGGSIVENIIARGPDQTLHLTFTYEWHLSGIEPRTNEAKKAEDDHMKIAVSSVQGTIKAMGKMAQENRI